MRLVILPALLLISLTCTASIDPPSPPPPIPSELRNVSFISRWIIFGTYYTHFITIHPRADLSAALDEAWNQEISSIIASSAFGPYLIPTDLQELSELLSVYKELGKKYITEVLNGQNPLELLAKWNAMGQQIALYFQQHRFDPNNELPQWFAKATSDVANQVNQFAEGDFADFLASYGSAVRNFQEIGFSYSPTPCQEG